MPINSLIFDLDGTLIDSSDGVVEAVNFAFRQMGLPNCPAAIIKPYIGYPLKEMFADLTDAPVDQLYQQFQTKAKTSVVDSAQMLDDVAPALRELRMRGYRMAIATTKIRVHVDAIIEKFEWQGVFDASVAGDEVAHVKPHPEAIRLAIKRLGTIAESALVIGDTENDILAAQGVPTRTVAVRSPYGGHEKVITLNPDFVVTSLTELIAILDDLHRVGKRSTPRTNK
jgi:pyrophosphatase PpaX